MVKAQAFIFGSETIDKTLKTILIAGFAIGITVSLLTLLISHFIGDKSYMLPLSTGFAAFLIVVFFALFVSFFGDSFSSNILGTGQRVDTARLEDEMMQEKANRSYTEGNYKQTIEYYRQLIYSPYNATPEKTAYLIGQIYEEHLNRLKDSEYWYRKSIALSRGKPKANENTFALESQNSLNRVAKLAEKGKYSIDDNLFEIKTAIEDWQFHKVESLLADAEKIYPDHPDVKYLAGHFHRIKKNPGMALEYFRQCMELDPGHILAAYFSTVALHEMQHLMEAKEGGEKYLELAKDDPDESDRIERMKTRLSDIQGAMDNPSLSTNKAD